MLGDDICLCIAGNKTDLEKTRHVDAEVAEEYARSVGAKHFHTSAKLNKGIDELFLDLSKSMIEKQTQEELDFASKSPTAQQTQNARRKNVVVVDDEPQKKSGGGCC